MNSELLLPLDPSPPTQASHCNASSVSQPMTNRIYHETDGFRKGVPVIRRRWCVIAGGYGARSSLMTRHGRTEIGKRGSVCASTVYCSFLKKMLCVPLPSIGRGPSVLNVFLFKTGNQQQDEYECMHVYSRPMYVCMHMSTNDILKIVPLPSLLTPLISALARYSAEGFFLQGGVLIFLFFSQAAGSSKRRRGSIKASPGVRCQVYRDVSNVVF